jgi:hypothetical protein
MNLNSFQLSRDTESATEETLLALYGQGKASEQELEELWLWLQETNFAVDPSRAWVGELAAKMLRHHGGDKIKQELQRMCKGADGWLLHFCLLALRDHNETPEYRAALNRAAASPEVAIRACAEEMIWAMKEKSEIEAVSPPFPFSDRPDESVQNPG